jgi:cyclophilin family peptidyl-prolyl cis-trans isomerase
MPIATWILLTALLTAPTGPASPPSPRLEVTTNLGAFTVELDREAAPQTVASFLEYVEAGFYDGTVFHRVIPGFMVQGGGFTADLKKKPTRDPIPNEADNGLSNTRGTIAMARTRAPHSATCQFFINLTDNSRLDFTAPRPGGYGYCVFGQVVEGMDVVNAIAGVPTGEATGTRADGSPAPMQNVPVKPVVIESIRVHTSETPAEGAPSD